MKTPGSENKQQKSVVAKQIQSSNVNEANGGLINQRETATANLMQGQYNFKAKSPATPLHNEKPSSATRQSRTTNNLSDHIVASPQTQHQSKGGNVQQVSQNFSSLKLSGVNP